MTDPEHDVAAGPNLRHAPARCVAPITVSVTDERAARVLGVSTAALARICTAGLVERQADGCLLSEDLARLVAQREHEAERDVLIIADLENTVGSAAASRMAAARCRANAQAARLPRRRRR